MLEIGKVIGTRGLKGEIKVYPYTNMPEDFTRLREFHIGETALKSFKVLSAKLSKSIVIIKLDSVNTIDEAEALKNQIIYIDEESSKDFLGTDSFYYSSIIGAKVISTSGDELGIVQSLKSLPSHGVFVIKYQDREWFLPHVDEFVKKIDLDKMIIEVELIEGLFDEN